MPPATAGSTSSSVLKGAWRPTKIMNMRDLSRDDDFLSHLLVEKLGTGGFPLVVHKMDPSRRLPKTDQEDLMKIVRRLVAFKGPSQTAIRQAVDNLLSLAAVRYYIRSYTQKQINAFATHASRYFELYLPTGSIEIAHTSRYSHRTGKSELCILATRPLVPGAVISELKGSMAHLTEEEDKELKGTDIGRPESVGIRRDFSVIHSKQLKKNHLFLGPARFVNHDCDHNVELFREGRYITFRVIKHIGVGEEVTAHYGDGYFGRNNRHCLCQTCESNNRGGYAPHNDDEVSDSGSALDGSSSDNGDESDSTTDNEAMPFSATLNVNERRTRRGVYAVLPDEEDNASDADVEAEFDVEPDMTSEVTSVPRSSLSALGIAGPSNLTGLLTPDSETIPDEAGLMSVTSTPRKVTPTFTISTRAQKARAASETVGAAMGATVHDQTKDKGKARAPGSRSASAVRQLETPPLTSDNGSIADGPTLRSSSRLRVRDTASSVSRLGTPMGDRKSKAPASARTSTADLADLKGKGREDPESEGRLLRRRPVVPASLDTFDTIAKRPQDGPRGVDGKLLPTCMTCRNVLPVISVDDKVVWNGLPEKTGKRGRPRKQIEQECPRCMRHLAIYASRWPERMPTDGTPAFVPAPRDNRSNTPAHISNKSISSLNHKMSNAASSSRSVSAVDRRPPKRQRTEEAEDPEPPPKKQKVASIGTGRPRGRPPKNKVGMSTKARELLGVSERRSGRTRVPSLKLRESEPPSKGKSSPIASLSKAPLSTASASSSSSNSDSSDSPLSAPYLEANDRHHLRSSGGTLPSEPTTPVSIKMEGAPKLPTPKSLAVASQPREANGRFGKKATTNGRYQRKFCVGAGGRKMARGRRTNKVRPKVTDPALRESGDVGDQGEAFQLAGGTRNQLASPPIKRPHSEPEGEDDGDDERNKRRRRNASEDDEELVQIKTEGEEGDLSVVPYEEEEAEEHSSPFRRPLLTASMSGAGLFSRPNPLTFARRKWTSSIPPEDREEILAPEDLDLPQSSSAEETDLPVTPEDGVEHPVVAVMDEPSDFDPAGSDKHGDVGDESDEDTQPKFVRPRLMVKSAYAGSRSMAYKPSPLNMSRRRWGPVPASEAAPTQSEEPSENKTLSMDNFTDLFEPDADTVSASTQGPEPVREIVDPDVSSEEEGFRGPSILSIYKPGRRSSSASSALLDLTDDSEQIVERLVSVSDALNVDTRPPSTNAVPRCKLASPQKPPSKTWQQTVLLPMNAPFLHHNTTLTVTSDIPPDPTKLLRAGWDSGSSDDAD